MRALLILLLILYAGSVAGAGPIQLDAPAGDARPALQAALDGAVSGDIIELGPGIYRVGAAPSGNWHLTLGGRERVTLRGVGGGATRLVFTNPRQGGIYVGGGSEVWIRELVIDYDPVPFTQGVIEAVDAAAGTLDVRLDAGFPPLDAPWFEVPAPYARLAHVFDATQRNLKAGVADHLMARDWTQLEAGAWRVAFMPGEEYKLGAVAAGDRFVQLARGGDGALFFGGCRGGGVENVTVHASPSLTCALLGCEGMTVRGLRIEFEPGTPRLIATNGDGIHCQRNRGGPRIEDCLFEGMCDDGVNIYAPPLVVREVNEAGGATELLLAGPEVRAGDELELFDPREGKIRGRAVATTSTATSGGLQRVVLDRSIAGVTPGEDHLAADTAFNLAASGRGYVIRNNTFRNHRRHGVLLRAGDGLIEGNTFEHPGGYGVVISNEPAWPEGPTAANVVVRGNRFIGGGAPAGYADSGHGAAIYVRGLALHVLAAEPIQRGIRIEHNTFEDPPVAAVLLGAVQDAHVQGNRLRRSSPGGPAVILEATQDVTLQGEQEWLDDTD